jgi:23S rRNA (guanosine2251-2'-O)-methyltransferase
VLSMSILTVKNPHSILAALKSRPQGVKSISLPSAADRGDPLWVEIQGLAQRHRIGVHSARVGDRDKDRNARDRERESVPVGRTGMGEARVTPRESISLEELFEGATEKAGGKGLWLALDSLQDPHNVGAIFRAAGFFGVQGILLTSERSAPLTETVYDISCGGVETVPFVIQTNLKQALDAAKEAGLWILGTSEHAKDSYSKIQRDRPWLMVLGNEEKGMRRLTQESCDLMCTIPCKGDVTSLNVSVAAGIMISHFSSN